MNKRASHAQGNINDNNDQKNGILAKIQEKEKELLNNSSTLCEGQKKIVDELRKNYFLSKEEKGAGFLSAGEKILAATSIELNKSYLSAMKEYYKPYYPLDSNYKAFNRIAYLDITRWVVDKDEDSLEKLVNVYQCIQNRDCSLALIFHRTQQKSTITLAISNNGAEDKPKEAENIMKRLINAFEGNFPGTEFAFYGDSKERKPYIGIPTFLENVLLKGKEDSTTDDQSNKEPQEVLKAPSVAIVTNLVSDKSEGFKCQGIEKLLDGFRPTKSEEEYDVILLATPVKDTDEIKNRYCSLYNELAPYSTWQETFTSNENTGVMEGSSIGGNIGISVTGTTSAEAGVVFAKASASLAVGLNGGVNFGKMSNKNVVVGKTEGQAKTCVNYAVKHSLDYIEMQIKRIDESNALGMWNFATYVVSFSPVIANNVASMYMALTQGEESYLSNSSVNTWYGKENREDALAIFGSIIRLRHPCFLLNVSKDKDSNSPSLLLPNSPKFTTELSGKELAKALNMPDRSVSGIPVIQCVSFGREVHKYESDKECNQGDITIGNIYHMHHDEQTEVELDVKSLASHVFVTGSTGSGKSNTIYHLISELGSIGCNKNKEKAEKISFLVIEPAKGEYKKVFGDSARVLGTNTNYAELLKINPFAFPKHIHVLEHIDRLVEILNACWPMYAAMPAVLKEAIERAYEDKGWDLRKSKCLDSEQYPTFRDVQMMLGEVLGKSAFSGETKGNYEGALITRVQSLTNGINGLVFCDSEPISDSDLFDKNVIVDLSRIGSTETKAIIMGFLVMKLQEYRMNPNAPANSGLKHITILEEAHNLLKRTSYAQSQGEANLQGKSVEIIANAIAEMRTYGEGFIIADQAPGLLDESVIRNTNTKIILRLPDSEDRRMVGRSAALTEDQIDELAKLPLGVAAVYQNNWVEAVLCHFKEFKDGASSSYQPESEFEDSNKGLIENLFKCIYFDSDPSSLDKEMIDKWIDSVCYSINTKVALRKIIQGRQLTEDERRLIAYDVFDAKSVARKMRDGIDQHKVISEIDMRIKNVLDLENDLLVRVIRENLFDAIEACMTEKPDWLDTYRVYSNVEVIK